ncbi:undecaprenyl-phosphate glucose phosphotransferase [Bradyrhizobium canariense]|uniref:Putative colanic acid biosysnthesis UDP-glucose lipid carrier transferase n=1 Tax=Bradyrhizobium canariense TaxID=255045 RepID=A0A1H1WQ18_9BRAD|nr:undecaprenyl-phosphate glucose phosphotransferase [Bradyrhizobium canariense]SDS99367.1 putative colanic acid biosysnthesis UDP-glucose lipid carrier transferase [Bradyrhizobium canariense]
MNFVDQRVEAKLSGDPRVAEERKWPLPYESVEAATICFDVATIALAGICASILYPISEGARLDLGQALGAAALVSALFSLLLKSRGLYRPTELLRLRRQVRLVSATWAAVFLLLSGVVFTLKIGSELSRGTTLLFAGLSLVALVVNRTLVKELLTRGLAEQRFSGRRIVLIADPEQIYEPALNHKLAAVGFDIVGNFALPPPDTSPNLRERLIARVIEHIRGSDVEEVIVATDPNRWSELRALAADLRVLPFPISFVPIGLTSEILHRPRRDFSDTVCVELQRGPLSAAEHAAKRCIDVVGAGLGLIVMAPLLVAVAIAIKFDSSGPVLFRQHRYGFNGRYFQICKFRTMSVMEDGFSAVQASAADHRVTRIGKWLRRTSIDELPQLLNVLGGSMSLVGPRPHPVSLDDKFDNAVRNYAFRRRVKPGLTGWAQIHGCRGPTPTTDHMERRVEHDLWYIDNWNLKLDLVILLQTPLEVLRGENAY